MKQLVDPYSRFFLGPVYGNAFFQVTRKFVQRVVHLFPPSSLRAYLPVLSIVSWFSFLCLRDIATDVSPSSIDGIYCPDACHAKFDMFVLGNGQGHDPAI